jgi:hypothetical protein
MPMRASEWAGVGLLVWPLVWALAGSGCVPRAANAEGDVVDLERGLSGEEVIARMGRRPDEVHRLGPRTEDWVYVDAELERSFVLRMHDDQLRWSKMIAQSGTRY